MIIYYSIDIHECCSIILCQWCHCFSWLFVISISLSPINIYSLFLRQNLFLTINQMCLCIYLFDHSFLTEEREMKHLYEAMQPAAGVNSSFSFNAQVKAISNHVMKQASVIKDLAAQVSLRDLLLLGLLSVTSCLVLFSCC